MKHICKHYFVVTLILQSANLLAQSDSTWQKKPQLNLSGFADVFYVYDFNQPQGSERQPFLYNHNRHNEFNLNLGFIKLNVEHSRYRANFAMQSGTYTNDNYAAEPGVIKNIFEANIGISMNKKNSLWLDAGILPSHIGFESAISIDNGTLTRSLLAENSPYYSAGARLIFTPNDKWEMTGLMLNGWQRIQRLNGNSLPSFGTQVNFTPSEKVGLNWSTFIGTDDPDSSRRMRYFNNFYGLFQVTDKVNITAGFDIGTQQQSMGSSSYDFWFSPVIIGQYFISNAWKAALRMEYYQDETGVIIPTGTTNGFNTTGLSLNFDYSPSTNLVFRIEGRWLNSKDLFFETKGSTSRNNFIIGTSIAIKFLESLTK